MGRAAIIVSLLVVLAGSVGSQSVVLQHKLKPGETLTYLLELSGTGTIAAMQMTEPVVMRGSMVYAQRCLAVDAQGNMQVRTTCAEPEIAAMWAGEVLPVRVAIPPVVVGMRPSGEIMQTSVERPEGATPDDYLSDPLGLRESLALLGPLLEELGMSAGGVGMMEPPRGLFDTTKLFGALRAPGFPGTAVEVGSQWRETVKMSLEQGAGLEVRCTSMLTALQPVDGELIATIRSTYETPLDLPMQDQGGAFTLSGTDKGTVTAEFSVDRGRVLKSVGETTSTMKMEAAEAVGLLGIPVSVSMATTTKYQVTLSR